MYHWNKKNLCFLGMVLAWIKEARTDFYYQNARQLISYETEQEKQISDKTNQGIPKKNWLS